MPKYKLIVLSGPADGREDAYNDWYQNVHLGEIMSMEGFKSGQRFRLVRPFLLETFAERKSFPYLAIYEVETDDIEALLEEMRDRANNGALSISDALSPEVYSVMYEELGPPVGA